MEKKETKTAKQDNKKVLKGSTNLNDTKLMFRIG